MDRTVRHFDGLAKNVGKNRSVQRLCNLFPPPWGRVRERAVSRRLTPRFIHPILLFRYNACLKNAGQEILMYQTVFHIAKMDCPSEEALIRMKLADAAGIHSLYFDIANRRLTVWHHGDYQPILQRLDSLNFDTSLLETRETDSDGQMPAQPAVERKLLWQV